MTECLDLEDELDLWFPPPADGVEAEPVERGVGMETGGGGGGAISKEGDVFEEGGREREREELDEEEEGGTGPFPFASET